MKHWSKKKTLTIGLSVLAVCLVFSVVYMLLNRSTKRLPTEQEVQVHTGYAVDWQSVTGEEGMDVQIILDLCTYTGEQTIGNNVYDMYTSETLGSYLYRFGEMNQIAMLEDLLYIQYTDQDGKSVTLSYGDTGLAEKAVYDPETDTLYYEQGDIVEVWEKFGTGIQFGG